MGLGVSNFTSKDDCSPASGDGFAVAHWTKKNPYWFGTWCYEGDICLKDHARTLDGHAVQFGGNGTCSQHGYTNKSTTVDMLGMKGQWMD